jgi:Tol biopolymer transport system component/DNA-binding winged helix-turn-helix (wHTH) protein
MQQKPQDFYEFGPFVLDTLQHVLLRGSQPVPLTPKTYDTLLVLVENSGRMLSKDELMKALWRDSFVEESNLTVQISAIRKALGEAPREHRYIVTVPGRGYRFDAKVRGWSQDEADVIIEEHSSGQMMVEEVEEDQQPGVKPELSPATSTEPGLLKSETRAAPFPWRYLLVASGVAVLAGIVAYALLRPALPPPRVLRYEQITSSGRIDVLSRIVTDGTRVYFVAHPLSGAGLILNQVSSDGGETAEIPVRFKGVVLCGLSPDHSELLIGSSPETPLHHPLWIVSVLGGSPRRLGNIEAYDAEWTPDGQGIIYSTGADIYVAKRDGSNPRKLLTTPGLASDFRWSPSGRVLRFTATEASTNMDSLWEVSRDGSHPHRVLPQWTSSPNETSGGWTPDGKYFVFNSLRDGKSGIWAIREQPSLIHKSNREPILLTTGPLQVLAPTLSPDGKRLLVVSKQNRGELAHYEPRSSEFVPYLPGLSAHRLSFTRNGQWVAYTTYPDGELWRSRTDGSEKLRLTFPPLRADLPRWSPDGKQIVFVAGDSPGDICLISAEGGEPQKLLPRGTNGGNPDWSPDGGSVVFGPQPAFPQAPSVGLEGKLSAASIQTINLKTGTISALPDSTGLYWPRWAASGKYIVCLSLDTHRLMLFDVKAQTWTKLASGETLHNPLWSADGKKVYFQDLGAPGQPIYRVAIGTGKVDRVAGSDALRRADIIYSAFTGLTPEDSPVALLIHGLYDIYALDLSLP